ncbi:hypothetical protein Tco_0373704 [Tanacetum coccineum]
MWAPRAGRHDFLPGGTPSAGRQTLQPGGWEVAGGIFLLDFSFKALARVVLGRGPSYSGFDSGFVEFEVLICLKSQFIELMQL